MPSHKTYLRIVNNTSRDITKVTVNETDNFDWDGDSRPDHNFQDVAIGRHQSRIEREELNFWAASAPYRMHVQLQNGDLVTFRTDQYDARRRLDRAIGLEGPNAADYEAYQSCDGETSTITLTRLRRGRSWMQDLPDDASLAALTIPGTHDTCALYGGLAVQTQTRSLAGQLESGIRFVDIRCRHIQDRFAIHHGAFFQNIFFGDVLNACSKFLAENPTETIVMSVKEEYDAENCTRSFEDTFEWYLQSSPAPWRRGETIPTVAQARGKIVLLRRFPSTKAGGIQAQPWSDDATFWIRSPNSTLRVQDEYKLATVFNIGDKWDRVKALLDEAQAGAAGDLYVNFASASGGAFPMTIAEGSPGIDGVNQRLARLLAGQTQARYGIVVLDFPEWPGDTLVPRLYNLNRFA